MEAFVLNIRHLSIRGYLSKCGIVKILLVAILLLFVLSESPKLYAAPASAPLLCNQAGAKWGGSLIPPVVNLADISNSSWKQSISSAFQTWNNVGTPMWFVGGTFGNDQRAISLNSLCGSMAPSLTLAYGEVRVSTSFAFTGNYAAAGARTWWITQGTNGDGSPRMVAVLVEINGNKTFSAPGTPSSTELDLQSVMVHEFGHAIGFPDLIVSLTHSVMLQYLSPGAVRRDLSSEDQSNTVTSYGQISPLANPSTPVPSNPGTNIPNPVTLRWSPVSGAQGYYLQICTSSTFANCIFDGSVASTQYQSGSSLLSGMTYYWRVKAFNGKLNSSWSPTNSFTVTAIAPPPSGGTDSMTWLSDISVPDGTSMNPNQNFTKIWHVKNTGTSTWGGGYSLDFVGGDQMGALSSVAVPLTLPNNTLDVAVNMTAPSSPGTYIGNWRMRNSQGSLFGDKIWVKITVSGSAPPPPSSGWERERNCGTYGVTLYKLSNFSGDCLHTSNPAYVRDLSDYYFNDMTSSVRVIGNFIVYMWEHAGRDGNMKDTTQDIPNIASWSFEGVVSSVDVQPQGACKRQNMSVNPNGAGGIDRTTSPNCGDGYFAGTWINLVAHANSGYTFSNWTGNAAGSDPTTNVQIWNESTATANFAAVPPCYSLTKNVSPTGSGDITANPSPNCNNATQYTSGTNVNLTANANASSTFQSWNGCDSSSSNTCSLVMNGNRSVTANFQQVPQYPDLRPYVPSGYPFPVVPSSIPGTHAVDVLRAGSPTYFDWHFINGGNGVARGTFYVELWVDNTRYVRYPYPDMASGVVWGPDDWLETINTPGWHTVRLIVDADNTVAESDETNNVWEGQFNWQVVGAPTNLSASVMSSNQINLSWTASPDAPSNIDGYRIYQNSNVIKDVDKTLTNYEDMGLACGTTYNYAVKAFRGAALSDPTGTVTAITNACDTQPPTMSWTAPVTAHQVYRAANGIVHLGVSATDSSGINHVTFSRWSAPQQMYLSFYEDSTAPYGTDLDMNTLEMGWNYLYASTADNAGNTSGDYIYVYRLQGIHGVVTYQGTPVSGINLLLRRWNGISVSSAVTALTTVTESDGSYRFFGAPTLAPGYKYYVFYENGQNGNANNVNYLGAWRTYDISTYTASDDAYGDDFDLSGISLGIPTSNVTVTLPYTFQWTRRMPSLYDNYGFELAGNPNLYWTTGCYLGYVDSYTLEALPPQFSYGVPYLWHVVVANPAAGWGPSYYYRTITFTGPSGNVSPTGGGALVAADSSFRIDFPAGAVSSTTTVTYTVRSFTTHPFPNGRLGLRHFTLDANASNGQSITQFQKPYTLVLSYTDAQLAASGIDETTLNLAYWNGTAWIGLLPCAGCSLDKVNNRITILADHFTEYALTGSSSLLRIFLPFIRK